MRTRRITDWLVLGLLCVIIALVFHQISTSMVEQNIASGGPYNNSASYPRAMAILLAVSLPLVLLTSRKEEAGADAITEELSWLNLRRPLTIAAIFVLFLLGLPVLGYHLTAAPMLIVIMLICGLRGMVPVLLPGFLVPLLFAYLFEVHLKIVLPGGLLGLNIAWPV